MQTKLMAYCLVIACVFASTTARAAFHGWQITKVYSDSTGSVQYVQMTALFGGQQFLNTHTLTGSSGMVFTFSANLPGDTTGKSMVLGTPAFAALNVVAPDYLLPANFLSLAGGSILFDVGYDLISHPAVPANGFLSVDRAGTPITPTVTNFTGISGTVPTAAPPTIPGMPLNVAATAGNARASIAFSPPTSNGGSPVTSYTTSCSPGPINTPGAASPIVVMGLTNGTGYTCTVTATNAVGTGPPSNPATVTPAGPPDSPTIGSATPGNGAASIAFSVPASNGSPITGYSATCNPGGVSGSSANSPINVSGLTNAVSYSCSVTASNAAGISPPSAGVTVTPFTVPDAPVISSASGGNGTATLAFLPPFDGGSAITGYIASCGAGTTPATGPGSPLVIGGLANGVRYFCTVTATNVAGPGAASAASGVTPATVPGAPAITGTIDGDGQTTLLFTAPASNGGAPILRYTADCGGGSTPVTRPASPITVAGLANNASYLCTVSATNAVGTGPASVAANAMPGTANALQLIEVVSRKIHGPAGKFDLTINQSAPIDGNVSTEPRVVGNGHRIVFIFNQVVANYTSVTASAAGNPNIGNLGIAMSGKELDVSLPGTVDNSRVLVTVAGVNGALGAQAAVGFLVGDAAESRRVGASDISSTKAHRGEPLSQTNFRFDLDLSGDIGASDLRIVKSRSGASLP